MATTLSYRGKAHISGRNKLLAAGVSFIFLLLQSCHPATKETRLLFTGDILLSRNVQQEMSMRNTSPWAGMKDLFMQADFVAGNLEGAAGNAADSSASTSGSPVFGIPPTAFPLLYNAGFKTISIENNHSFDLGDNGKTNTIKALLNAGIAPVYYTNSPQFITINNVTIAIVAINLVPDREHSQQEIPSIEIKQKLRLAKSLSNLVIVTIHWGSELLEWPNQYQRKAARWLVDNGADLIIGSHPHVIQDPEMVNGKPVFFSLGNHLFDQKYAATKEGMIADCIIRDGKLSCTGIITHTRKNSFFPEITGTKKYTLEEIEIGQPLSISEYELRGSSVNSVNTINQCSTILQGFKNDKKVWQTYVMPLASIATGMLDGKNNYLVTLEKHFSNMDSENNLRPYVYQVGQNGLISRWRGSALAWPLLDAIILPGNSRILCALHRGDSFIDLNPSTKKTRVSAYQWNGFGFSGDDDSVVCKQCSEYFKN